MADSRARSSDNRPGLSGLPGAELTAWFEARGEPAYRARQVIDALWKRAASRASDLTTLPQPLGRAVDEAFRWMTVEDERLVVSDGGQTEKALHRLADGATVESV